MMRVTECPHQELSVHAPPHVCEQEVAKGLAGVAPNSLTLGSNEYTDSSGRWVQGLARRHGVLAKCRSV